MTHPCPHDRQIDKTRDRPPAAEDDPTGKTPETDPDREPGAATSGRTEDENYRYTDWASI